MKYRYFLYSEEQIKEKSRILTANSKLYQPGTVVVNGTRRKYTQLSEKPNMDRFIDSKVVAEGYIEQMIFVEPSVIKLGGK